MINFLSIILFFTLFIQLFSFLNPPNNRFDFGLGDSNYELAKEYYEYKTKQISVSSTLFFEKNNEQLGLSDDDYVDFAKNHEKNYRIFTKNWFIVKDHNKNSQFKLELNKFADNIDFNDSELPPDLMSHPIEKNVNNKKWFSGIFDKVKDFIGNNPREIDWRKTKFLTPVKNQKNCGSCWAFSSTSALEAFLKKNKLKVDRLSEQELVDCSTENYGCGGGLMDLAFDYCIENGGLHSDENYPYNARDNKCMKNCKVKETYESCDGDSCDKDSCDKDSCDNESCDNESCDNNCSEDGERSCKTSDKVKGSGDFKYKYTEPYSIASLKESVNKNPVSIAINANTPLFRFYSDGVVEDSDGIRDQLNHAVLLVGYSYDEKGLYWIIQNSWGKDWGDNGFIKVRGKEGAGVLSCQIYGVYPIKKIE